VGLLITLSPEIAREHRIDGLKLSTCFILFQVGITCGDLLSGVLSQWVKSRKKVLLGFMTLGILATIWHFIRIGGSLPLYITSLLMGLGCGYLSVFVTATAEHFGINLRVTVTATVTNFMRGAVVLLIPFHQWAQQAMGLSLTGGLAVTAACVWALALLSAAALPDTFGKSLAYTEE
jgi:riboflavin transporter FmnP